MSRTNTAWTKIPPAVPMDCMNTGLHTRDHCFRISFNAKKQPIPNNSVISPAKYGIISVMVTFIYKF
jgi:hypothetical protein